MSKKGYLGKAIKPAVDAADTVIDKAIDTGAGAAKKAADTGKRAVDTAKDMSGSAKRAVAGAPDIETLERLGKMQRDGLLTDDEFKAAKARILERI